jgi:hypothetical protein
MANIEVATQSARVESGDRSWRAPRVDDIARYVSGEIVTKLLKSAVIVAGCVAAIAVSLWLTRVWLGRNAASISTWSDLATIAGIIFFALLAVAAYFRIPAVRKRQRPHFVLRPVQCTSAKSEINPQALTLALSREINWLLSEDFAPTTQTEAAGTLTVASLSISVEWIWGAFRRAVMATPEIVIESLCVDDGLPIKLQVWARGYVAFEGTAGTLDELVRKTVRPAALHLIETLNPIVGARAHAWLQAYDDAIRIFRAQPPSLARDLDLARILTRSHQDAIALEQIAAIRQDYRLLLPSRNEDVLALEAFVDHKVGNFEEARKTLNVLLRKRPLWSTFESRARHRGWRMILADCDLHEGKYGDALRQYEALEQTCTKELLRVTRLGEHEDFDKCLRRCSARPTDAMGQVLEDLDTILDSKAACLRLKHSDPIPVYERRLHVLETLERFQPSSSDVNSRVARVHEYLGRAHASNPIAARKHYGIACAEYANAINNMSDSDSNFAAGVDHAWCSSGQLSCQRALSTLADPELHEDLRWICMSARELIPCVSEDEFPSLIQEWNEVEGAEEETDLLSAFARFCAHLTRGVVKHVGAADWGAWVEERGLEGDATLFPEDIRTDALAARKLTVAHHGDILDVIATLLLPLVGISGLFGVVLKEYAEELEAGNKCIERFHALTGSTYHECECAYGIACLRASLLPPQLADSTKVGVVIQCLKDAIDLTSGGGSVRSGFIGRARIDFDFDHIRDLPEFRAIVGLSNAPAASHHSDSQI